MNNIGNGAAGGAGVDLLDKTKTTQQRGRRLSSQFKSVISNINLFGYIT